MISNRLWAASFIGLSVPCLLIACAEVWVWDQDEVIPTYVAGEPEKNRMFYFGGSIPIPFLIS